MRFWKFLPQYIKNPLQKLLLLRLRNASAHKTGLAVPNGAANSCTLVFKESSVDIAQGLWLFAIPDCPHVIHVHRPTDDQLDPITLQVHFEDLRVERITQRRRERQRMDERGSHAHLSNRGPSVSAHTPTTPYHTHRPIQNHTNSSQVMPLREQQESLRLGQKPFRMNEQLITDMLDGS